MATFHYKATNTTGQTVEGDQEANDRFDLAHRLRKEGLSVIIATEKKTSLLKANMDIPFLSGVNAHDKITFARNLGSMIEAGLPLTRALSISERQSKGELKKVIVAIEAKISTGSTLSDSLKDHPKVFSELFVAMVKAGEESGNLVMALKNVAMQLEKSYELSRKVRGALIYPAIIVTLMLAIGILMMIYMVPTLSATFKSLNVPLPLPTRIIIGMSDLLTKYIAWMLILFIGFVVAIMYALRTHIGKRVSDFISLHLPIISNIVKQVNAARTARTLSSLISSGVDIIEALAVTEQVLQNSYYKEVIKQTESVIQKGEAISKIFSEHENLYPVFVGEMVSVGEETGKIGDMLMGVAEFYESEVDQKTKDMSSVIEPFLMIAIGLGVGLFAISIISPIYSLGNNI